MSFNVQKVSLLEGLKVAQKTIGRSTKKADALVELTGEPGRIVVRAISPGLCQIKWSIVGIGDVPFIRLVAPLDTLRGVVERMPSEDISVRIDPKNELKLRIQSNNRSGTITMVDSTLGSIQSPDNMKLVHEGDMSKLVPAIKMFDSISLGGFNAWGCVCATPDGTGYATDEGNLYAAPFPVVEKADRSIMLPTQVLTPATLLSGPIKVYLSDDRFVLEGGNWTYTIILTYVQSPNYKKVIDRFIKNEMVPIDLDPLTKEIRDFRKACKVGSLIVSISQHKIRVQSARDAVVNYKSERDIKKSPNVEFTIIPENYLKVGPNFHKKSIQMARVNGSHLFFMDGECNGIVSCHSGSIKFS